MQRLMIAAVLVCFLIFISVGAAYSAPDEAMSKSVKLGVSFCTKSITEREYENLAQPVVSTSNGATAEVVLGDADTLGSFKAELTPVVSETNPDLIMVTVKAWEVRFVTENGKAVKRYVLFTDDIFRVRRGTTASSSERTVDRDVRISITPNIE